MKPQGSTVDERLTGGSLGERHRSLNRLVLDADAQLLDTGYLANWTDKSLADQIYIAKLADHTKNATVLCDLFASENQMVVATAMHATWLFQGITNQDVINADNLINNVFPKATTHTVCRIVSLLSAYLKNEQLAEDLFNRMLPIYGHNLTFKLLPSCNVNFIRSKIMDGYKIVSCSQLKRIFKKDAALAVEYLDHNIKKNYELKLNDFFLFKKDYVSLWTLVAEHQPDFFFGVLIKNHQHLNLTLGSRVTLKIVKSHLKDIIENPSLFLNVFHKSTLLGQLKGDNLEKFLVNVFNSEPVHENEFDYNNLEGFIKHLKPGFRVKLVMNIYSKKYNGASILLRKDFDLWSLIEDLPSEERNSWAQNRIANITHLDERNEVFYLRFASAEAALPRLIFLIGIESDKRKRIELFDTMIHCCKINKDHDALLSVLKYTAKRHRNDQILCDFLNTLQDDFKLHQLPADHWVVMNELLSFLVLNTKNLRYNCTIIEIYKEKMLFCLDHGLEIDSVLQKLVSYGTSEVQLYGKRHENAVIEALFRIKRKSIEIYNGDSDHEMYEVILLLLRTYQARSDRREHSPTECEWLMEAINKLTPSVDAYYVNEIFNELGKDVKARKIFSDKIFASDVQRFSHNFLKHDASVVIRNTPKLLEYSLEFYKLKRFVRLFRRIRAYFIKPMLEDLLKHIEEHCKKIDNEAMMTVAFALFQDINQTEANIKKYIPTATTIDPNIHGTEYENGKSITKCFKYVNPPISFDTLSHFVKGDYLKLTLPAVFSLTYKKSRTDAVKFVMQLLDNPVSIKKHGIRLVYFFIPWNELLPIYRRIWNTDKNMSIREVLVQRTFKILDSMQYTNEELENIWNLVKYFIGSFTELDAKLFEYLNHTCIPIPLITDYWILSWSTLKMLSTKKADVRQIAWDAVATMALNVDHLSADFSLSIVHEYIKSIEEFHDELELYRFVAKYLINLDGKETQAVLVEKVCGVLKRYIVEMWDKDEYKNREIVVNFVAACCRESLNPKCTIDPTNLLKSVHDMLSSTLPSGNFFDLETKLDLCTIYWESFEHPNQSSSKQILRNFGQKASLYMNIDIKRYGIEIYPLFCSIFEDFIDNFLLQTEEIDCAMKAAIISGIIMDKSTNLSYLLAVDLLPDDLKTNAINFEYYNSTVLTLIAEGNITIKMVLDKKYKLKSSDFIGKSIGN